MQPVRGSNPWSLAFRAGNIPIELIGQLTCILSNCVQFQTATETLLKVSLFPFCPMILSLLISYTFF